MLREDSHHHLTNCLPTVLGTHGAARGSRGYDFPFNKSFDSDDMTVNATTTWTVDETDRAIEFVEQLKHDSGKCAKALARLAIFPRVERKPVPFEPMSPPQHPTFRRMLWDESEPIPQPKTVLSVPDAPVGPDEEMDAMLKAMETPMDPSVVRSICVQAEAMAEIFGQALASVRKVKVAYGDLIISMGMQVPFDGDNFTLHEFDGFYMYVSEDGDKTIPF
jgi:hypothetical protein